MCSEIITFTANALAEEFGGDITIYAEEVKQGVKKPCFFLKTEGVKEIPYIGERFLRKCRLLITFYPEDNSGKQGECERTAERLFDCLKFIDADDRPLMGSEMSFEIKDGLLLFHVDYNEFMYRAKPVIPKMEILQQRRKDNK